MATRKARIAPGAVVCQEAELNGEIVIGTKTVVHPKARIIAEVGPIIIGENNLIEEQCVIRNVHPDVLHIGNYNTFEVGTNVEAISIGDHNIFEAKSIIGSNVSVSNGCVIGAMCHVETAEVLPPNTIIYGRQASRRTALEKPQPQTLQLDFLTKILPNYHHLKKPQKHPSES